MFPQSDIYECALKLQLFKESLSISPLCFTVIQLFCSCKITKPKVNATESDSVPQRTLVRSCQRLGSWYLHLRPRTIWYSKDTNAFLFIQYFGSDATIHPMHGHVICLQYVVEVWKMLNFCKVSPQNKC